MEVNADQAELELEEWIRQALAGEEVVITCGTDRVKLERFVTTSPEQTDPQMPAKGD